MPKYLIVNADDLGMSPGVNRGILEAHEKGIVTSTTVMINMPAAEAGIRLAQQRAPRLGLGLHINLSFGAPVSDPARVPSLVLPDGRFCSTYEELIELVPRFKAEDLQAEITAQMARFIRLAGCPPDHLDSHHGITYMHPAAFDVMLRLAAHYQIPIRNGEWFLSDEAVGHLPPSPDGLLVHRLRAVYAANARPRWPLPYPAGPAPELPFYGEGATLENLLAILARLPEGVTELMCHPGYAADLEEAYAAPREQELRVLTDIRARQAVEREGIRLITFAEFAALPEAE